MEFSNFYTIESLQDLNSSHDYGYPVTQNDADKVNRLIAGIQRERKGHEKPVTGDIIEYTSRNGDYYAHAHIGLLKDTHAEICLSDNIPFCYENGTQIGYEIYQGVWAHPDKTVWEPAGIRARLFKTWGYAGRRIHGTLYFKTFVRSWKYTEPEPLFGKYTSKDWAKYFLNRLPDPERKGEFFYKGDGFTLYSEQEFKRLVEILHGKVFAGTYRNSLILWGYRIVWELLSNQEWNGINAEVHISFLGDYPVKIQTCHDTRTVFIYKKK